MSDLQSLWADLRVEVRRVFALIALLVPLAACEEDFDPIAAIDGIFSINGYLDASADTQWVRVTPIRTSILTTPDPVDAVVTLEHLGTGRVTEMSDTVFTFVSPNFEGGAAYGHNFWTTEPIERGESYKLTARRSDGESATAVVKIPRGPDADAPVTVKVRRTPGRQFVAFRFEIAGGDHLAAIYISHHRRPPPHRCTPGRQVDLVLYPFQSERPAGPITYESTLLERVVPLGDPPECIPTIGSSEPPVTYIRWDGHIVLSGERWPFSLGDPIGYLGRGSNIQNGVGYFAGVVTTTVPLPFCGGSGSCDFHFGGGAGTIDVKSIWNGVDFSFEGPDRERAQLQNLSEGWSRVPEVALPPEFQPGEDFPSDIPTGFVRFRGLPPGTYRVRTPFSADFFCTERTVVLAPYEHKVVELEVVRRVDSPTEPLNERGCREG